MLTCELLRGGLSRVDTSQRLCNTKRIAMMINGRYILSEAAKNWKIGWYEGFEAGVKAGARISPLELKKLRASPKNHCSFGFGVFEPPKRRK
jgi:hypothetical protein